MPFEFGEVVFVPFTNRAASKKRPAVIVSNRAHNDDPNSATGPVLQESFRAGVQSAPLTQACPHGKGHASCCLKSWLAVVRHSAGRKTMSEHALMYQIL